MRARVRVVAVGRLRDPHCQALCDEYEKRLGRHVQLEHVEVRDGTEREVISRLTPHLCAPGGGGRTVAMEVHGEGWDTDTLARRLDRWRHDGGVTGFLIGGAHGLPRDVCRRVQVRLSLSPMTLPHRLARVLLMEQLYRAFTILQGHPYNH